MSHGKCTQFRCFIVGAAVFAASKVLGPLWSKVSILRYHISGPLDDPQINEVLRQPRKESRRGRAIALTLDTVASASPVCNITVAS
ncbi:hypothetical protein F6P93_21885 [Escherichia coli]|nr:hypothetical protein F6P93_21885 [Escherichia coli]